VTREPLARLDHVSRRFGDLRAVDDVSFDVLHGDRIALIGPSGSGKTTLLHLLAGLDAPTTGSITWPALGPGRLRPGPIAVVHQAPSLLPALDVTENVALPLLLAGESEPTATRRATESLARLGLANLRTHLPDQLSGGQAQRVALARAAVTRPRLLLADEPTGQVDRELAVVVVDALLDAVHDGGAIVVSTHDPLVADRLATRWTMHDGRLVEPHPVAQ
jgi:putative ABC transport system ATP-binding protein